MVGSVCLSDVTSLDVTETKFKETGDFTVAEGYGHPLVLIKPMMRSLQYRIPSS
jgi:hypothetical protein